MFGKIEHLGIAVANLEEAEARFTALLGVAPYKREEVASEGVITSFFMAGVNKIELLQGTHPDSPISKFIEKRGEGIHHTAFHVDDIYAEMQRLKAEGFTLIHDIPKRGADQKLICFLHPKTTQGALIELCQDLPEGFIDEVK
jgi:methylmalonyl-CoA/ethylmalonyl-CoA epimerase